MGPHYQVDNKLVNVNATFDPLTNMLRGFKGWHVDKDLELFKDISFVYAKLKIDLFKEQLSY